MILVKVEQRWEDGRLILEIYPETLEERENINYSELLGRSIVIKEKD